MKKQIKPASQAGEKLSLNKKTLSNLQPGEMNKKVGGQWTTACHGHTAHCSGGCTNHTCSDYLTCYTC